MLNKLTRKVVSILIATVMIIGLVMAIAPANRVQAATTGSIINVNSAVNVRSQPTTASSIVTTLALGSTVNILDTVNAESSDTSGYPTWYKVSFVKNGTTYQGYVASHFVKKNPSVIEISDEEFEKSISSFPESYKPYLRSLHQEHPAWTFTPVNINVDWFSALNNESQLGHSLIEKTVNKAWLSTAQGAYDPETDTYKVFDSPNWVNASRGIIAYYMDPRNNLTSSGVFQFLNLSYEEDTLDESDVEGLLSTSFMAESRGMAIDLDESEQTYAHIFIEAGNESHVNPIFLAAKVLQEVGTNGSTSSNGTRGLYNFYNIGAYSNVFNAALVGLNFAEKGTGDPVFNDTYLIPWNSQGRSIVGGAKWISNYYINAGQNTIYFMRFNFNPNSKYSAGSHQYMTATQAATSESSKIYNAFRKAGILETNLNFSIPVYSNMPETACPLPTATNSTQQLIKTSYNILLGRDPSEEESKACAGYLQVSNPVNMIAVLAFDNELTARNLSDEEFLSTVYMALTGVDLQPSDKSEYMTALANKHSRKYVFALMANTYTVKDYFNTYGVESGTYTLDENEEAIYLNRVNFVELLYNKFLGRGLDRAGMETWTNAINSGYSGPQIAAFIFTSSEYQSKNMSNEEYVRHLYSSCLGREADPEGLDGWVQLLDDHVSRDYVLAGFLNSEEYRGICEQFSISTEPYIPEGPRYILTPDREKIGQFVTFLYNSTLSRDPDEEGYNSWIYQITQNGMTGEDVAYGFIFSQEMNDRNVSNEEFINILYHAFLGRDADYDGFYQWAVLIESGTPREEIFEGFVYSREFTRMCADAGFKPYESFGS